MQPDAAGARNRCVMQRPPIGMIECELREPAAGEPPHGHEGGRESRQRSPGSRLHDCVSMYLTFRGMHRVLPQSLDVRIVANLGVARDHGRMEVACCGYQNTIGRVRMESARQIH